MEHELEVFRKLAENQQEQIDRLISLVEEAQSCAREWRDIALEKEAHPWKNLWKHLLRRKGENEIND